MYNFLMSRRQFLDFLAIAVIIDAISVALYSDSVFGVYPVPQNPNEAKKTGKQLPNLNLSNEEWFNYGKAHAWAKRPKLLPEQDSIAATMYDLGYSEGLIQTPPTARQ